MTCKHCCYARQPYSKDELLAGCAKQPESHEHDAKSWYEGWFYPVRPLGDSGSDDIPSRGLLHRGYLYPIEQMIGRYSEQSEERQFWEALTIQQMFGDHSMGEPIELDYQVRQYYAAIKEQKHVH